MTNRFIADEGFYFARADKTAVYGDTLILGVNDTVENYVQMPIEQALKLKEKIRLEHEEKIKPKFVA